MPDSTIVQVADAVVASLNAGSFSQEFTAERRYRPTFELADLETLRVSVVPGSLEIINATRTANYFDCSLDIGVQKRINLERPEQIDALMRLVEELVQHLWNHRLELMPEAVWLRIVNEPVVAAEHLDQQRVFTSVLTVTYRVRR